MLVRCLNGAALTVFSGIPPTGDNYYIILNALTDKYEDKRILANSYLEQLFRFKQSQAETYQSLNSFIEKFHTAVTALKKLNPPDLVDYFLAYLALEKLNPEIQKLFENTKRKTEMPSYQKIVDFVKE